jgi:hypothetical protein
MSNKYSRYHRALYALKMCEAKAQRSVTYKYTVYPFDWLMAKLFLWLNK